MDAGCRGVALLQRYCQSCLPTRAPGHFLGRAEGGPCEAVPAELPCCIFGVAAVIELRLLVFGGWGGRGRSQHVINQVG